MQGEALTHDKRGSVYVEFLLVFPPLFVLFLVTLQWSILATSSMGVTHAASAAVRSAVVVLPDDPVAYDGYPQNFIPVSGSCSEGVIGKINKLIGKVAGQSGAVPEDGKCTGGPRLAAIRFAAVSRMMPFAPNVSSILPGKLGGAFGALGQVGWLAGAALYSYGAVSVNFPTKPGSDEMAFEMGGTLLVPESGQLTVRVNYLAHCGIPIARFLMCDSGRKLGYGVDPSEMPTDYAGVMNVLEERKKRNAAMNQLGRGVGSPAILTGLLLSGERFMMLSADATLPMNDAPYSYKVKQ